MLILKPIVHETIWGGNRINKIYPTGSDKIGHLYMVSGHADISNVIENGDDKGKTLRTAFDLHKEEWNLSEYDEFPLTIAIVDASDNLSIQVHPDDCVAQELEGMKIGKKESWLFLEAPVSGWIYGGCEYTSVSDVAIAVEEKKIERVTSHLPIERGMYACVSAGTLHAMTAGCLVYEIEYGSNYTYRFYDYDRKDTEGKNRPLHIPKALKALKTDGVPRVCKMPDDIWVDESVYMIKRPLYNTSYINEGKEIECISVLSGTVIADGKPVISGKSILLFPGEILDTSRVNDMVVARLSR